MQSSDPVVARDGAEALKGWGTAKAEALLWKRLELWHEQWNVQAAQLLHPENRDDEVLGTRLVEAIAQGIAWLTDPAKLRRLNALCVSHEQHDQVARMEDNWKDGPKLEIIVFRHNVFWPHVTQYEY